MAMIFGKRQWLFAQGITAFAQLYRESFPDPRDEKHTIAGLITITGYGTEPGRGGYVQAAMNPDLFDLMVGEGQRPMFMVTNAVAMLSYREQELSYLPAAQFALELLARQNLYNRSTATLSTPAGDGFAISTFMDKFGLVQGPREKASTLKDRLSRLCKGLMDKGVIATIKRDGGEREDWRASKLLITMSDDYMQAYNLNRMRQRLAREEKLLAVPFAPRRVTKKAA